MPDANVIALVLLLGAPLAAHAATPPPDDPPPLEMLELLGETDEAADTSAGPLSWLDIPIQDGAAPSGEQSDD